MSGVTISRDDAIEAIGALELRMIHNRELVDYYERRGDEKRAAERREAAQRYQDVIARIREAMTAQAVRLLNPETVLSGRLNQENAE